MTSLGERRLAEGARGRDSEREEGGGQETQRNQPLDETFAKGELSRSESQEKRGTDVREAPWAVVLTCPALGSAVAQHRVGGTC